MRALTFDCSKKMNGVLSVFKPDHAKLMHKNQGLLDGILAQQKHPFHTMFIAEYMAKYVDDFTPKQHKSDTTSQVVKNFYNVLVDDQVIVKNPVLLNASSCRACCRDTSSCRTCCRSSWMTRTESSPAARVAVLRILGIKQH